MNEEPSYTAPDLPNDVDPALSFFSEKCGGNDYLYNSHWHTFPGRMSAYCPHNEAYPDYRISADELPKELPLATRYWVAGFMAGNLPEPPEDFLDWEDDKLMSKWRPLAAHFAKTGYWPGETELRDYLEGRRALPYLDEGTK